MVNGVGSEVIWILALTGATAGLIYWLAPLTARLMRPVTPTGGDKSGSEEDLTRVIRRLGLFFCAVAALLSLMSVAA